MDYRKDMLIAYKGTDKEKILQDVKSFSYDNQSRRLKIAFNNGSTYPYNYSNVIHLKNPTQLDPAKYQISHNGKLFSNIDEIYAFSDSGDEYWYICCSTGFECGYKRNDLNINVSVIDRTEPRQIFNYLREVVNYVQDSEEDNSSFLAKQYEKINFLGTDTAASAYLAPDTYKNKSDLVHNPPIFPFGCNESQFQAVTNALSNQISVIEGPPGTGKTQTILNIIANLILYGKSVQVVSNNNSAIDNVIEKLASPKYSLDFIAARLGNVDCKDAFISKQTGRYPDLSSWVNEKYESYEYLEEVRAKSLKLRELFEDRNRLAELKKERHDAELEYTHYLAIADDCALTITNKKISSRAIMQFLNEYQDIQEERIRAGFIYRLIRKVKLGIDIKRLASEDTGDIVNRLQYEYYKTRISEIDAEMAGIEARLNASNADEMLNELTEMSILCFRAYIARRYMGRDRRKVFAKDQLWQNPDMFIEDYPVVLSTTYTARSSLGKKARFDYVIMDEASQVDVATGMLALTSAYNAVIVGDRKQLPNVVKQDQKEQLAGILQKYNIPSEYDFARYSFLASLCAVLDGKIASVTLREHYRCHPQIIGFCNQKFYEGKLIIMTEDNHEDALSLVTTVAGEHRRDRMNQRQIDVIKQEILPELSFPEGEIGIIAPYRNQVLEIRSQLKNSEVDAATVHKFQGREKDAIIFSTVDDQVTQFSDDPNLLNVAISRAKKKLILVASEQEQPTGSVIGDLIGYIRYNNCDVKHSEISSVFDYLYSRYSAERLEYLKKNRRISEYDSENLMYILIQDILKEYDKAILGVICHQPLNLLLTDMSKLSEEEKRFVNTGLSHIDFLIYNKVSKQPVLAIEVDGFHYHKEGTKQAERDKLKDHILEKYGLPLIRFKTNGSGEKEKLIEALDGIFKAVDIY